MNNNIIPYIPIADRVQATTAESTLLCQNFFVLVDEIVESQMVFNHDTKKGHISINPAQINDLLAELGDDSVEVDVQVLEPHLSNLIYPKFIGVKQVNSPIWNGQAVMVWHFRLDEVAKPLPESAAMMLVKPARESTLESANDYLSEALGMLRIWRASLETHTNNPQLEYHVNDVTTMLLEIEQKLNKAKNMM